MCTEYGRNEMQRIVEFVSCQFVKVDWSPTLAELKLGRRRQALEGCEPKANKSSFSFSESEGLGLSDLRYRRTTTIETHVVMKLLVMMMKYDGPRLFVTGPRLFVTGTKTNLIVGHSGLYVAGNLKQQETFYHVFARTPFRDSLPPS